MECLPVLPVLVISIPDGGFIQVYNNGTISTNIPCLFAVDSLSGALYEVRKVDAPDGEVPKLETYLIDTGKP